MAVVGLLTAGALVTAIVTMTAQAPPVALNGLVSSPADADGII
jgi:hypothetical protein